MESANHYLLQVKGNQPKLQQAMNDLLLTVRLDVFEQTQKGHGKHSEWIVSVFNASKSDKRQEWTHLNRLIHVHKQVLDTKSGEITHSDRLYISDLHTTDAAYYAQVIRGHWSIENLLHRVKDVAHNEDKNEIGQQDAAMNSSTLSTIALNLHRMNGRDKIKKAQIFAAANCDKIICELRT